MLGCQDFCGYYDWTFDHVRRKGGQEDLLHFWAEAIGRESQAHYEEAARTGGLRGLLGAWTKTGEEEHCDWTFTLDEERNTLRWDMRRCPSKYFLLDNNLNTSEDYCDHCMGWVLPLLERAGAEVVAHEHNHCGQCWAEMSMKGRPHEPLDVPVDIRRDPNWRRGYIDRWRDGRKLPLFEEIAASTDPCDVLEAWFSRTDHLVVLGRGPSATEHWGRELSTKAVLVTGTTYATRDVFDGEPIGVLIGDRPIQLDQIANRYLQTPPERRPLLMHLYLPEPMQSDFGTFKLPRPVPILPWLIRQRFYTHRPQQPRPTPGVFLVMLAISLGKKVDVAGIDNYRHPSGRILAAEQLEGSQCSPPAFHTPECDLEHLRQSIRKAYAPVRLPPHFAELLARQPETLQGE